jgi:hypothetical protein
MPRIVRMLAMAAMLTLVSGALFAANGDTINIGGQVPLSLDLTVTPDTAADNLTLTAAATTATTATIATIDIATNNTAGWELWVFSNNAGAASTTLTNADGDTIGYKVTYGGAGGVTDTDITNVGLKVGEDASNTSQTGQLLQVNYSQEPDYPAGYYSDQLSIVLRAK